MKFKVIRSKFIEGLKSVQNIVAGKGSLPILQNVMIEGKGNSIKLTTTDLDISIKAEVECEIIEEGMTTLPVKLLFVSVMKAAEGEVTVECDGQERATIKTAYAASQDDTRRTLKGVLMSFKDEKLTMVATDGRRLALVENEIEFPKAAEKDIVLPSKAVAELQRSLAAEGEMSIMVKKSQICFSIEKVQIYSKLMDDTYPNYRQVIPKECAEQISIDRQLLLDALDRASVMTMDEAHSTKLIFDGNRLTVTSAASDIGEAKDEVPIKYAGEKIEIMFNPTYVMDPLKAIDDDEVTIGLNNGHSPAVIKCSIPFLYVLMPLRIN